jgi:Ca-activated chloride channel family protein
MTLVLIACELNDGKPLTPSDLMKPEFKTRLSTLERGLAGMSHSTGTLMNDMVTKGPSVYDAVVVYESLVLEYLKAARGRWGDLRVAYPRFNLWSDNPYYILDVPWSTKEHRQAAQVFLRFLMSEPMQKLALEHGFRPGNIDVPIRGPDSPFIRYKDSGVSLDVGELCPPPSVEIIDELLQLWENSK